MGLDQLTHHGASDAAITLKGAECFLCVELKNAGGNALHDLNIPVVMIDFCLALSDVQGLFNRACMPVNWSIQ